MYEDDNPVELDGPFKGRLAWNGSQDLQDVSIQIINVTYDDSGVYECHVLRKFEFDFFTPSVSIAKDIKLKVIEKGTGSSFPRSSILLFRPVLSSGLAKGLVAIYSSALSPAVVLCWVSECMNQFRLFQSQQEVNETSDLTLPCISGSNVPLQGYQK